MIKIETYMKPNKFFTFQTGINSYDVMMFMFFIHGIVSVYNGVCIHRNTTRDVTTTPQSLKLCKSSFGGKKLISHM